MLALLSNEARAELLEHLDEESSRRSRERMPRVELARVLDLTKNDIAADVLRLLPPAEAARVLAQMTTAADVTPLMIHPDESAGGLMTRGFVALHKRHDRRRGDDAPAGAQAARRGGVLPVRSRRRQPPPGRREPAPAHRRGARDEDRRRHDARCGLGPARIQTRKRQPTFSSTTACAPSPWSTSRACSAASSRQTTSSTSSRRRPRKTCTDGGRRRERRAFSPLGESIQQARRPGSSQSAGRVRRRRRCHQPFRRHDRKGRGSRHVHADVAGQAGNAGIQTSTIMVRGMALGEVELRDVAKLLTKEWALGAIKGIIFGVRRSASLPGCGREMGGHRVSSPGFALIRQYGLLRRMRRLIPLTMRYCGLDPAPAQACS